MEANEPGFPEHVDDAGIERRLSFADAASGAESMEVTDPVLRDLSRQVAAGTLAVEAAGAADCAHIDEGKVVRRSSVCAIKTAETWLWRFLSRNDRLGVIRLELS